MNPSLVDLTNDDRKVLGKARDRFQSHKANKAFQTNKYNMLNSGWTPLKDKVANQNVCIRLCLRRFGRLAHSFPACFHCRCIRIEWTSCATGETQDLASSRFQSFQLLATGRHRFSMWSDKQRKWFLLSLLSRCRPPQLYYVQDFLDENKIYKARDFTQCLPKYLSLYIFSFLSPRDLSRCSTVSSHWKVFDQFN
jgi:hypothetical protein